MSYRWKTLETIREITSKLTPQNYTNSISYSLKIVKESPEKLNTLIEHNVFWGCETFISFPEKLYKYSAEFAIKCPIADLYVVRTKICRI